MDLFTKFPFGQPIQFESSKPKPRRAEPCKTPVTTKDPLNKMGAHEMVSQFVNVKKCYRTDIGKMADAKKDRHARRFYCTNDCAFIFDVAYLEAIVRAIRQHPDPAKREGAMILFQGLREDDEDDGPFGRPTLIATAYVVDGKELEHTKIPLSKEAIGGTQELEDEFWDGIEHPGDGSSPEKLAVLQSNENYDQVWEDIEGDDVTTFIETPIVLDKGDEHAPTDYFIKTRFSIPKLKASWTLPH